MKKKIKGYFMAVLMTLVMTLTGLLPASSLEAFADTDSVKVKIHYHRFDGNYEGWNLWLWGDGKDGAAYEFNGTDDFGAVCETTISGLKGSTQLGFIVRYKEWERKDVDMDRFVDISDGTIEIYLAEGDSAIYTEKEKVDLSAKITGATLNRANLIDFSVNIAKDFAKLTDFSDFKVVDNEGKEHEVKKVSSTDTSGPSLNGYLVTTEDLDLSKSYTLQIKGYRDLGVTLGDVLSSSSFADMYTYEGDDLGVTYKKEASTFKVWAPTASNVELNLYKEGNGDNKISTTPMTRGDKGVWSLEVKEDLNGVYYTYSVTVAGKNNEAVDLYARSTGVNGERGLVFDLEATNPEGWEKDKRPELKSAADSIIYELHVRDLSSDASSGIKNVGKFLGVAEIGTKNSDGKSTGLDHIKELGATHIHFLPIFDYGSVDETKLDEEQFNWGYDPMNYNVPEGSYSTDPYHGEVRVNELKQMVQTLHKNNLRVVMDVVYNHTYSADNSNFTKTVPNYYYRFSNGKYSNGSGCGNETASERSMVRKYIVDSVVYWAKEYHIDGFRFDLMGIHDIETMNAVKKALKEVDPSIIVYGEGWSAGDCGIDESLRAVKANISAVEGVAAFSDDIRDGIKGSVFDSSDRGFVTGKEGMEETIKFGVVGSVKHSQVKTPQALSWASAPTQTITYESAHDNLALWDKIASSNPNDREEDRLKMNLLGGAIIYTSQGIPFMQAGEEILRSKVREDGTFDENSYKSSDAVNSLKWYTKTTNETAFLYYKGLIALRKQHSAFRMETREQVEKNIKFIEDVDKNVVAYTLGNEGNNESAKQICVIYNANKENTTVKIPKGTWKVYVKGDKAGTEVLQTVKGDSVTVEGISAMVLVKDGMNVSKIVSIVAIVILCIIAFFMGFRSARKKQVKK